MQPERGRLDGDVLEDQGAVTRAEVEVFDLDFDSGGAIGKQGGEDRVLELAAEDGGDFAGHAEVAPEVGTVGDGFVVDLEDAIGKASGEGRADLRIDFEDAGVIAVDGELGAAGQHAVAFDAIDDLLAERDVGGYDAGAAVGRAADDREFAVAAGVEGGLDVVAGGDGLDGFDASGAGAFEEFAGALDAFALGGLHGDELFEGLGGAVEVLDEFADPIVGELH